MSAKTLRRDRCEHERVQIVAGWEVVRDHCQKCGAEVPVERRTPTD